MAFPLYKEWMSEVNKVGVVLIKGVKDFVKYAKRNLKMEEISCLKDDLWETPWQEFKIPVDQKEEVLKEMGLQLKTWRRNLRSKYFENLDINEIKALKDKVPEKEQISLSQWNEFINCEATEAKMKQRDKGKASRAKKTDVHCLGRQS